MGGQSGRQNFWTAGALKWQDEPGSSQLGCCTVNGPRVLGLVAEWGLMELGAGALAPLKGYALNYFGAGTLRCADFELQLVTEYPFEASVEITFATIPAGPMALWVRIPSWSKRTTVKLNGQPVANVVPGSSIAIDEREPLSCRAIFACTGFATYT
jgi:DUF1680 family protein